MSVTLSGKRASTIAPCHMKDGEIGEVMSPAGYAGSVVQRSQDNLIKIGARHGQSWSGLCGSENSSSSIQVRLLEEGEQIIYHRGV